MKKIQPTSTNTRKYKDAPEVDVNELAEKWVELMIETIISKDRRRLTNGQILTYAEAGNTSKNNEHFHHQ